MEGYTLKKWISISLLILSALILGACNKEKSKDEVIDLVEEHMDEVSNYYTETEINHTLSDLNQNLLDETEALFKVHMHEDTLESRGEMMQDGNQINYISTKEATYAQMNDEQWQNQTDAADVFLNEDTDYSIVTQILLELRDNEDVEMKEKDGDYMFTFQGKSADIYKTLEKPYALTLEHAETTEVEQDLTITVDSETYFITHVNNELFIDVDDATLEMYLDQTYENINETDPIKIPQEVIDEAS